VAGKQNCGGLSDTSGGGVARGKKAKAKVQLREKSCGRKPKKRSTSGFGPPLLILRKEKQMPRICYTKKKFSYESRLIISKALEIISEYDSAGMT